MTNPATLRRAMDTIRLSGMGHPVTPDEYGDAKMSLLRQQVKFARRAAAFAPIPAQEYLAPTQPSLWGHIKGLLA